ncbi:hypothetical protein [Clostridium sp. CF012]|uniref:hypothetical protein n=1 Tax=Clostridium sp. CF012 TaxID=2843319 RepID=UPI001C0DC169|nr:hypothetical protein [Clostridium sp. CF012]MBU3143345.1 hypothetical protein [Clostridium sp. CF012]
MRDSRFIGLNTFSSTEKGYPLWTDAEGNYSISNLPKGEYNVELDIPLILLAKNRTVYQNNIGIDRIIYLSENEHKELNFNFVPPINIKPKGITYPQDNKVNIKWEKVEGAAYYYVNITTMYDPINLVGSSGAFPINQKIADTSYTLDIEKMNNQNLAQFTNEDGLVNNYEWAIEQILKLPKEDIKEEQYSNLADIYLRLKDFNGAKGCFNKARTLGLDYLYDYPLLELYLEDFNEALKLSQNISGFLYSGNKNNFIEALKEIKNVDKTSEDYKAFREILRSVLSREKDYKKKYKDNNSKIKNSTLSKMMTEIAIDYNLNEE